MSRRRGLIGSVLDLLFPPRCPFCRTFLREKEELLCSRCKDSLPFTRNGGEQHGDFFSLCAAPLYYEDAVRESLLRYKFQSAAAYADAYGVLLAACIRENLSGCYDLISWVPLSKKRLHERGYDQAFLLAESTAAELNEAVVPVLKKVKHTAKQSASGSAEKRRANIAGAYAVTAPEQVAGKRILLIDDIVTTGSTFSECARTLREAGAAEVICAALARSRD